MAKHPVPKKKTSKARRDQRRSHHALEAKNLTECPQCKAVKPQHQVCAECGYYGGKQVMEVEA